MVSKGASVRDFISDCILIEPSTPVSKVIGLMKEKDAYEVFSVIGDKVGTVTVRDILKARNPANMKAENLLSFVPKITPDTGLFEAAKIMSDYRLRALPVSQDNKVIGKIDIRSIVSEMRRSSLGDVRASKIMTPHPITIAPGEKVSKAREIMVRRRIDHLPIKEERVKGILTSEQIVFNLITDYGGDKYVSGVPDTLSLLDYPVEAIMDRDLLQCEPQTSIRDVAERMLLGGFSYALVTLGEELHGIITYRDFAKLVVPEEEASAPVYIVGLPDDPFEAEAAKAKFIRLVASLSRFLPQIIEARSIIKIGSLGGQRRRYEVDVSIRTARESFRYTTEGWDLPTLYDEAATAIKRMATSRKREARRGKTRPSIEGE